MRLRKQKSKGYSTSALENLKNINTHGKEKGKERNLLLLSTSQKNSVSKLSQPCGSTSHHMYFVLYAIIGKESEMPQGTAMPKNKGRGIKTGVR